MYSENQLTLSSQATHHHLIKSPSDHPDSLKSCAMAQIWMLHDDPSASTTSSSSQATLSSRSIYHHVKLASGQTILDTTWSDPWNDGKDRQWYCSMIRRTRVVKSCNGVKGWCHVKLKMGRSSSPQSQVWIWIWYCSNQKVKWVIVSNPLGRSPDPRSNRLNILHDRSGQSDRAVSERCIISKA